MDLTKRGESTNMGAGSLWPTVSKLLFGPYHVFFHRLCIAYACQQMSGP
jgi:hypothetical protein